MSNSKIPLKPIVVTEFGLIRYSFSILVPQDAKTRPISAKSS